MAENTKYYIKVPMKNKDGKMEDFYFHPGLFAIIETGIEFMNKNRHFFGLVTGGVGDGKSNIASSLSALWEHKNGRQFGFENMVWTTKSFIEKTNREDNKTTSILWDEAIQGVSGKKMALTNEGEMLKIAIVTKRFKKHFYLLLVDEIEEYSWKLIKMANFWIHLENNYGERGYFKAYLNKSKIKAIYTAFKMYKWDWSKITLKPDIKGRFFPYLDRLLDEDEYDKMKLAETQQIEESQTKGKDTIDKVKVKELLEIQEKRLNGATWEELGGDKTRMFYKRTNEQIKSI